MPKQNFNIDGTKCAVKKENTIINLDDINFI